MLARTLTMDPRSKARQLLIDAVDGDEILGHNLEVAIYNHIIKQASENCMSRYRENKAFRSSYTAKVRSMRFNLTNPRNPSLKRWVLQGRIAATDLVKMTAQELDPEHWVEAILEAQHMQAMRMVDDLKAEEVHDGLIQCNKCKSRRVTYYEMQTRSADEPMTVYAHCLNCKRRWKM